MFDRIAGLFSSVRHQISLRRWGRLVEQAPTENLEDLRADRIRARQLRQRLDRLIHIADGRLTLPMLGSTGFLAPAHSDWSHRPEAWSGPVRPVGIAVAPTKSPMGTETTLHHDCKTSELTLRQIRNTRADELAPFGLQLDVLGFDGSFLSLVVELPDAATDGLERSHILHIDIKAEAERPLGMFARLNIKNGPNTEQITRELDLKADKMFVEFDLAYTKFNEKHADKMWVDLIFDKPEMNQITIFDVTLSRRVRAEI